MDRQTDREAARHSQHVLLGAGRRGRGLRVRVEPQAVAGAARRGQRAVASAYQVEEGPRPSVRLPSPASSSFPPFLPSVDRQHPPEVAARPGHAAAALGGVGRGVGAGRGCKGVQRLEGGVVVVLLLMLLLVGMQRREGLVLGGLWGSGVDRQRL